MRKNRNEHVQQYAPACKMQSFALVYYSKIASVVGISDVSYRLQQRDLCVYYDEQNEIYFDAQIKN